MITTETTTDHATVLLEYLQKRRTPVLLNDEGLFHLWRETALTDLEIIAALDFLSITGKVGRSTDKTLRCRVWVKE